MQTAGYILGRMQYAPTGLRPISTDKEYYTCRQPDTFWDVCNMPLLGYDQLLQIKNISYADGRVYAGAYAIHPYRVTTNFYR